MCDDLRDEAEGVRLWLKRSRASFRLDVLSWDSEPESWDCCEVKWKDNAVTLPSENHHHRLLSHHFTINAGQMSHLVYCDIRL